MRRLFGRLVNIVLGIIFDHIIAVIEVWQEKRVRVLLALVVALLLIFTLSVIIFG
ncbi:hypothetical protein KSF_108140 [Reticulibacter mediterranei]|uniref:Uncharacterized protein n=1 Tax=Reticulibacter mediterranei TaxID=2778369 RepID=A0A8J3ITY6_9CHLR|nr:hypothetical protein KSF_108140 [Reticulibacter mediterranei]